MTAKVSIGLMASAAHRCLIFFVAKIPVSQSTTVLHFQAKSLKASFGYGRWRPTDTSAGEWKNEPSPSWGRGEDPGQARVDGERRRPRGSGEGSGRAGAMMTALRAVEGRRCHSLIASVKGEEGFQMDDCLSESRKNAEDCTNRSILFWKEHS